MKIMIHASPARMWYVNDFLIPSLLAQGMSDSDITVWNDTEKVGNLRSCMNAFASCEGDGGTWHLQDDVLICSDFVKRCEALDRGLVYGFCNRQFTDDPQQSGRVHIPDAWHSFQCVRIPDPWARECAEWFEEAQTFPEFRWMTETGKMDDAFFAEFINERHPTETVYNAKPCLVEHVDVLMGGSVCNQWRGFWARAHWFEDEDLVQNLRDALKNYER